MIILQLRPEGIIVKKKMTPRARCDRLYRVAVAYRRDEKCIQIRGTSRSALVSTNMAHLERKHDFGKPPGANAPAGVRVGL